MSRRSPRPTAPVTCSGRHRHPSRRSRGRARSSYWTDVMVGGPSHAAQQPTRRRGRRGRAARTRRRARSWPRSSTGPCSSPAGSATAAATGSATTAPPCRCRSTIRGRREQVARGAARAVAEADPRAHSITRWLGRRRTARTWPHVRFATPSNPGRLAARVQRRSLELLLGRHRSPLAARRHHREARRRSARELALGTRATGPTSKAAMTT